MNESLEAVRRHRRRLRNRTLARLFAGLNAGTAVLLLLILTVMFNYLSSRHYVRFNLGADRFYELSEKTLSLLDALPGTVTITVFIQPGHELYGDVYSDVIHLLREYEYAAGGRIRTERIDPDRNLSRAEDIMTRYGLEAPNVVIFSYGERVRAVSADELLEVAYEPGALDTSPEPVSFRGEQAFSSAVLGITSPDRPQVYYMQGHGERNFDDRDEHVGLSELGRLIRRDDIDLRPFSFADRKNLPEDADALIIAGPTRDFSDRETERIAAYVNRAGRLILMLNAKTDAGFGPLLESWGIESKNNVVVDPDRTLSGYDLMISEYADHPVTEGMRDITTLFYWPRALPFSMERPAETRAADEFRASALALSSASAWAELSLDVRPYRFDTDTDIRGPLPIALAVEKGSVASLAMDIRPTRIAIFGDVDFVSNSGLSGGNSDLFMNALNWILEREQLIAIAPRPVEEVKLMITARDLRRLFITSVIAVPLVSVLTGLLVWWRRRS